MTAVSQHITPVTIAIILLLCITGTGRAQDTMYRHLFRVSEENDLIKLLGDISDKGYTNGTRFEYCYIKKHDSRFFIDRLMPKAGKEAINTFFYSLEQTMYTPEDLTLQNPEISDWPYTGALFLSHSLNSSNKTKAYSIHTEVVVGVMGKASMAGPVQKIIHKLIDSDEPMGWDKQYPTDILLNLNAGLEKRLIRYGNFLEVIGGGKLMAGTMLNGASISGMIRIGKMSPYFDGHIQQYNRRYQQKNTWQLYFTAKPSLDWVGYNAVLQGGVFRGRSDYYHDAGKAPINNSISRRVDLGLVLGYGCVSLSFIQRLMPRLVDGFAHQRVGNISLTVAW